MKKNTAHKITIPIMLALVVNQIMTGLLGDKLSREAFEFLHEGGGVVLACLVFLHLALNFNWLRANYFTTQHK